MKTTKLLLIGLAGLTVLLNIGCGKGFEAISGNSKGVAQGNVSSILPCSNCGSGPLVSSKTVDFTPVSIVEMNNYVAIYPLNDPKNFKVTVDLVDIGSGRFAGTVKIAYLDGNIPHEGIFAVGASRNQSVSTSGYFPGEVVSYDNGVLEAEYNRWFKWNNQDVFTGFFQDSISSIVLVIEGSQDLGDAQGPASLNGSIWYHNFGRTMAAAPFDFRKCWFVYIGPYACRSDAVINKNNISIDGYTKLGTFSGLSRAAAFR